VLILGSRTACALCGSENLDLLLHLRIVHDVLSPEEYIERVAAAQSTKERAEAFREYIAELTRLRDSGKITVEEWRQRAGTWDRHG
jgi:hypothetical protein